MKVLFYRNLPRDVGKGHTWFRIVHMGGVWHKWALWLGPVFVLVVKS